MDHGVGNYVPVPLRCATVPDSASHPEVTKTEPENPTLWPKVQNNHLQKNEIFLIINFVVCINLSACPRGVMDNTQDSGSCTGGSIPSEGATVLINKAFSKI